MAYHTRPHINQFTHREFNSRATRADFNSRTNDWGLCAALILTHEPLSDQSHEGSGAGEWLPS